MSEPRPTTESLDELERLLQQCEVQAILSDTDDLHQGTTIRLRLPVVLAPVANPTSGST